MTNIRSYSQFLSEEELDNLLPDLTIEQRIGVIGVIDADGNVKVRSIDPELSAKVFRVLIDDLKKIEDNLQEQNSEIEKAMIASTALTQRVGAN